MALVDELKKQPGMYNAANAELADVAYKTGANYQNPVTAATRAALSNMPQGQIPGMFDVGTTGQRSLVGQKIIDPIKGFFAQSAAQARGEAVPAASPSARPLTAGIVPAANAAAPNTTQQPAVSDAYADEGHRGAAKTALSQLANSSVAGGQNFADWQKGATQMQRDTAADAYREAWQERTPQGMRGADANATALYNAEQATRGTGVTAQRGKNGTMEFSGDGANALPQSFTQGVDLNLANERNARANAIRQQMIDSQPGTRASIGNSAVEETNARFQASRDRDAMQNMGRSQLGALAQMRNTDMQRERMNAEMALRGQELEGTNAYRQGSLAQQAAQTDVQRQRLGIDQQEAGTRALTAGINDRRSQAEMAEVQRIGKLRDAYMAEPEGSPKREQIGRALLMLQGKEPSQPRDEETKARYGLITELAKGYGAMPPTGPDGKPIPFDQYADPVLKMASGNRGGNGQQAPSYEQYAAQVKSRDPNTNDKIIAQEYMKRFGS